MAEKMSPRILKTLRRFAAKKSLPDIGALGDCFDLGLLETTGKDDDGDPIWSLTEAGRRALDEASHDR